MLFDLAYIVDTVSTLLYLAYLFTKRETLSRLAFALLTVGLAAQISTLILRTLAVHHVPWSTWYESLSFFATVMAGLFWATMLRLPMPVLGAFIMPIVWLLMTGAGAQSKLTTPLPPELRSVWMAVHVPVMFGSYALLGMAFAVGLAYLIQERQLKSKHPGAVAYRLPSLEDLDGLIFKLVATAFPFLTLGIFLGGMWAYSAWGRFWNWDPKETWALITWMVYLVYLSQRLFAGWRGRKAAYLSMAGFIVVLFTYGGVNYFSPLHGFIANPSKVSGSH